MIQLLVEWAWKGSLILAAGLVVVLIFWRVPARARVGLLCSTMLAAILVPIISLGLAWLQPDCQFLMPKMATMLQVDAPAPSNEASVLDETLAVASGIALQGEGLVDSLNSSMAGNVGRGRQVSWVWLMTGLWVAGFAWLVLRDAFIRQRLRRYVTGLSNYAGDGHPGVDIIRVDAQETVPWVCRMRNLGNCLVLPAVTASWSVAERGMTLAHEMGHLRHNDPWIRRLALWMTAAIWFNPLAWVCRAILHRLQEEACDAVVLEAGYPATEYATWLLALTRKTSRHTASISASLAMARSTGTGQRIRRVLAGVPPLRARWLAGPAILLCALVLGLALVSPVLADAANRGPTITTAGAEIAVNSLAEAIIKTISLPLTPGQELEAVELRSLDTFGFIGPVLAGAKWQGEDAPMGPVGSGIGLLVPPLPAMLPFAPGTKNLGISLGFGPNIHPIRQEWFVHQGIDIAGPVGTKVIAPVGGRVVETGSRPDGEGNYLILEADESGLSISTYQTRLKFAHLQSLPAFRVGDKILAGQLIGLLGNSGVSTGAHLHYELILYQGENPVMALDPMGLAAIAGSRLRQKDYRVGTGS